MTTIVSKDIDEFVKDLAWGELRRLNSDVEEFLRKYQREDAEADLEKVKKQLLQEQEDKKDGK
jgi:hypothetical protein